MVVADAEAALAMKVMPKVVATVRSNNSNSSNNHLLPHHPVSGRLCLALVVPVALCLVTHLTLLSHIQIVSSPYRSRN